jgi:hypothetical protein
MADQHNLMRMAKYCTVEYKQCDRNGIVGDWTALANAKVISITHGMGAVSNSAEIELSDTRWNAARGVLWGYVIRCRCSSTVLFQGFIVDFKSGYSTAVVEDPQNPPAAKEWVRMTCLDYRWLYNRCSPVYGQVARGVDDYNSDGTKKASATFMRGRRCIFNPSGYYNMDPDAVAFPPSVWPAFPYNFTTHVFGDDVKKSASGTPWTAGKAINLLMSPIYNRIPAIVLITDPLSLPGLTHTDFNTVLDNIIADCHAVVDAIDLICDNIGWTFREQYTMSGPAWVFYKPGIASGTARVYTESGYNPCVNHTLHTPAVGEDLADPDGAIKEDGAKLVCAMDLTEDIKPVVNQPWGLGAPHQFEITAELVPAWKDTDLHIPTSAPWTSGLFYTESDLASQASPNSLDYFKYHHAQGSSFREDVGRKWALNESGKYTGGDYDRGTMFDFTTVGINDAFIAAAPNTEYPEGKRLYGPFKRHFKQCLTLDKDTINSMGVRLQWSKDGGVNWQDLVCPIDILAGEAAVRLTGPNLAEIVDISKAKFTTGDYTGQEINFFTSLADDKHAARVFKTGGWNTRLRITATIQMDQRDRYLPTEVYNGSPFIQSRIYDFADRYTLQQRCSSSIFHGGSLPAWNTDELAKMNAQMELIRKANEDMAIHGRFVLDRLWLDGTNPPDIMLGDCVTDLTGRNYPLSQTLGSRTVSPLIVEIQYLIQSQKQVLLLRDPRLSIVVHDRQLRRRGK